MEINGRNYHDPEIQLREIKLAISRSPADASLRPHFDFLLGLIEVQTDELQSLQTIVEEALEEFQCEEGADRQEDLEQLIDFARGMRASFLRVEAGRPQPATVHQELLAATP